MKVSNDPYFQFFYNFNYKSCVYNNNNNISSGLSRVTSGEGRIYADLTIYRNLCGTKYNFKSQSNYLYVFKYFNLLTIEIYNIFYVNFK